MNQVLGFETGAVNFVPDIVGSTLKTSVDIANVTFTLNTNDTVRYKFYGTEYWINGTRYLHWFFDRNYINFFIHRQNYTYNSNL